MHSAPHEIRTEDSSETEPILLQLGSLEILEESSSLIAISVAVDSSVAAEDTSGLNVDEDIFIVRPHQPQCRICLDIEGEELIAPCHCKGTQTYVNRSCIDNWRSTKEFGDVFPEELPQGLPPLRGIEHQIDLVPGSALPNRPAYRSNPEESKELQRQVLDQLLQWT